MNFTHDIGFHLSADTSCIRPTGASWLPITLTPTFNNPVPGFITSTNWLLYETDYVASGGERYLTIGNFLQSASFFYPTFAGPNYSTGYFLIDNVSVIGPDAVPEPSTFALLGGGLLVAGLARRRRSV